MHLRAGDERRGVTLEEALVVDGGHGEVVARLWLSVVECGGFGGEGSSLYAHRRTELRNDLVQSRKGEDEM